MEDAVVAAVPSPQAFTSQRSSSPPSAVSQAAVASNPLTSPQTQQAAGPKTKKRKPKGPQSAIDKKRWTDAESQKFLEGLYKFGKDFEKIPSRLQTKNRDQIRFYYYRLLRKVDQVLESIDAKAILETPASEAKAIAGYLELTARNAYTKSSRRKSNRFANCLVEIVTTGSTIIRSAGRNTTVKLKPIGAKSDAPDAPIALAALSSAVTGAQQPLPRQDFAAMMLLAASEDNSIAVQRTATTSTTLAPAPMQAAPDATAQGADITASGGKSPKQRRARKQTVGVKPTLAPSNGTSQVSGALDLGLLLGQGENGLLTAQQLEMIQIVLQKQGLCVQPAAASKLTLQLEPKNFLVARSLESASHNPRIMLTFRSTKSLTSILSYLLKKWTRMDALTGKEVQIATGIRLYPPGPAGNEHVGWGEENAVGHSVYDIFQRLGCPKKFQLDYAFNLDAATVAAYITPLLGDFGGQPVRPSHSVIAAPISQHMEVQMPVQTSVVNVPAPLVTAPARRSPLARSPTTHTVQAHGGSPVAAISRRNSMSPPSRAPAPVPLQSFGEATLDSLVPFPSDVHGASTVVPMALSKSGMVDFSAIGMVAHGTSAMNLSFGDAVGTTALHEHVMSTAVPGGVASGTDSTDGIRLAEGVLRDAGAGGAEFDMNFEWGAHMSGGSGVVDHFSVFESVRPQELNKENTPPTAAQRAPKEVAQPAPRFVFDQGIEVSCDGFGSANYFSRPAAEAVSSVSFAGKLSSSSAFSAALAGSGSLISQPQPAKRAREEPFDEGKPVSKRTIIMR